GRFARGTRRAVSVAEPDGERGRGESRRERRGQRSGGNRLVPYRGRDAGANHLRRRPPPRGHPGIGGKAGRAGGQLPQFDSLRASRRGEGAGGPPLSRAAERTAAAQCRSERARLPRHAIAISRRHRGVPGRSRIPTRAVRRSRSAEPVQAGSTSGAARLVQGARRRLAVSNPFAKTIVIPMQHLSLRRLSLLALLSLPLLGGCGKQQAAADAAKAAPEEKGAPAKNK